MKKNFVMEQEYRGEAYMRQSGWKRLASRVWQKNFPDAHLRGLVKGDRLQITVAWNS